MKHKPLDDMVAVVSGSGRGIGRAHALALSARGAAIVVNDLDSGPDGGQPVADLVVGEIRERGGTAAASYADITSPSGGESVIDTAVAAYGRVDIVVHNAGVGGGSAFGELDLEVLHRVLAVHLLGGVHLLQPAWRLMQARGYGRVVLTSSSAIWGLPGKAPYCMAKSGLVGLARSLKHEADQLQPGCDIKVNVVSPIANTRLGAGDLDEVFGAAMASPDQVAAVVAYLCSPECELNGVHLHAGGGHVARVISGLTRGWAQPGAPLVPEDIAANLARIVDPSDLVEPDSVRDVLEVMASGVLGSPDAAGRRIAAWLSAQAPEVATAAGDRRPSDSPRADERATTRSTEDIDAD